MGIRNISMYDIHRALGHLSPDEIIVDVRSPMEFNAGHVPGSVNIPYEQITDHANEFKKYATIYLYCRTGNRVGIAARMLMPFGVTNLACVIDGGLPDWIKAGFPIE